MEKKMWGRKKNLKQSIKKKKSWYPPNASLTTIVMTYLLFKSDNGGIVTAQSGWTFWNFQRNLVWKMLT